jgi:hypothetical protein
MLIDTSGDFLCPPRPHRAYFPVTLKNSAGDGIILPGIMLSNKIMSICPD